MLLQDKVALITGCGSGIGRAIALAFAREGSHLVGADLEADEARSIAEEVQAMGRRAEVVAADVAQEENVRDLVESALLAFGHVDVLVNNAGTIVLPQEVSQMTAEAWDRQMAVNVRSVFLCCRAVLPAMIERGRGRIINIASTAGLRGLPDRAAYCASKHAVVGFTRALAIDMKPHGIAVNAVCPGAVDTPLIAYARPGANKTGWMQPGDIASVVVFLASDGASAMTGAVVEVSGWS